MMLALRAGWVRPTFADAPIFDRIPIFDQGSVGDCTGQAQRRISSALTLRKTNQLAIYSAFFSYAMTRLADGTPLSEDSGCNIPDVQETWERVGICREELCPTVDDGVSYAREPSDEAKADAAQRKGLLYFHAPDLDTIIAAIVDGFGVSIGATVFENMMSEQAAKDGKVHYPVSGEKVEGGHDIVLRGWDADMTIGGFRGAFKFDNSWGDGWGDGGRGYLPGQYVIDGYATDAECPRDMMVAP